MYREKVGIYPIVALIPALGISLVRSDPDIRGCVFNKACGILTHRVFKLYDLAGHLLAAAISTIICKFGIASSPKAKVRVSREKARDEPYLQVLPV